MIDRESINHLVIFVIVALILAGIIFIGIQQYRGMATEQELNLEETRKEMIIKRQVEELRELREAANYQPPSQEEIEKQIEELRQLRVQLQ